MPTKIEWTDESWNPITGCTKVSPGCANCYAERMAKRLAGRHGYPADDPFRVTLHHDKLDQPKRWRKPRRIFVCSMGDLFHEAVPTGFLRRVFVTIQRCPQHTFLILTKRAVRMVNTYKPPMGGPPNVGLGVTVENQEQAGERIPYLLKCPAVMRFISVEPLLSELSLCACQSHITPVGWHTPECPLYAGGGILDARRNLDQIIIGPETGLKRRPCDPEHIHSLVGQADAAGVPVFVKAFPVDGGISKTMAEWPAWARRREFPDWGEADG